MNEDDLKTIVIRDLHAKGINVINFKKGTFDLMVEGSNPIILELKMITAGGKKGFIETEEGNKKEFTFTEDQTRELKKTKFPIYVLANDGHNYYLFDPKWVKSQVEDLKEYDKAIIYESRWNDTDWNNISPITYDLAINNIVKIVNRR
ncbi:hypothetical protein AYK25_05690 [Thermoplasmatales archaeon SM1-50]|nr:MAG: hypothetical protein AYK25_05690 [Thermoplasmatales archaeon SM1-50]